MNIRHGELDPETIWGPGVIIDLRADEVATAIHAYLVAHQVYTNGPITIQVNDSTIESGQVYVDPSGSVVFGGRRMNGNGTINE